MNFLKRLGLWTAINIVVFGCGLWAFLIYLTKKDIVMAAAPAMIFLVGLLFQSWMVPIAFLFHKSGTPVLFIAVTLVSALLYSMPLFDRFFERSLGTLRQLGRTRLLALGAAYLIGSFGIMYARHIDFPHISAKGRSGFHRQLSELNVVARNERSYYVGGFIDSEYLWMGTVSSADFEKLIGALSVQETHLPARTIERFASLPPYWWNPEKAVTPRFYVSLHFPINGRGGDGLHYLVMYDVSKNTLFAWIKDNF